MHLHRATRPRRRPQLAQRRRRRRSTTSSAAVDVGVGRRAPSVSRSAPGRPRSVDAHRREHVRRLHRPAGARRRRRRAHAGLVEQVQQRLALDALDAARGPSRRPCRRAARSRARRARRRRARRRGGRAAPRCARRLVRPLGVGRGAAPRPWRRCRRRCGCRCGARAPARRRRAAARAPTPSRTSEHADALRPAELVGAQRQQVDVRPRSSRRSSQHAACTASVCSTAPGARSRDDGGDGGEVGDRADLVVDRHHADDGDVVGRARRRARRGRPGRRASTPTTVPPWRSTACSTAWCSAAGHTAPPPAGARRRRSPRCRPRCRRR